MSDTVQPPIWSHPVRLAELDEQKPTTFALVPDAALRAAIAAGLGLSGLKKLRFEGNIHAAGDAGWQLHARLGATVIQPCVLSLAPVTTRIDEKLVRHFDREAILPAAKDDFEIEGDFEIPAGEEHEVLGAAIDPGLVMVEALALALPAYPRADDAKLARATFTEPGKTPLDDEQSRPFAGLRALRDKLGKDDG